MKKCDETPVLPLGDGVPDGRGPATADGSASPGMHATSPPQPGSRLFSELVVASGSDSRRNVIIIAVRWYLRYASSYETSKSC